MLNILEAVAVISNPDPTEIASNGKPETKSISNLPSIWDLPEEGTNNSVSDGKILYRTVLAAKVVTSQLVQHESVLDAVKMYQIY